MRDAATQTAVTVSPEEAIEWAVENTESSNDEAENSENSQSESEDELFDSPPSGEAGRGALVRQCRITCPSPRDSEGRYCGPE